MRFFHRISGFGTDGCVTGQFEFDLYDEYDLYGDAILEDVPVQLVEANSHLLPSRTYYISKRSISKKICHFVAYDIMSRIEQDFHTGLGEIWGDEIPCGNILEEIRVKCGFTSIAASSGGLDYIKFTREQVSNKTYRAVLEMVAEALCGVWLATKDNGIVLSCFGQPYDTLAASEKYSEIDCQGHQKITKLIMTNSETGDTREYSTGEYGTVIFVESPFVAAGTPLDGLVWERLKNHVYQAWHCDKALIEAGINSDVFIPVSSRISFGEAQLLANNVTLDIDSTGIYFSGGCDPQDEEQWKYRSYLDRKKIGTDTLIGNTMIKSSGRIVFVNKNKEG